VYFDIVTAPKHWDMDTRHKAFLAAGSLLFVIIFFIDVYFFSDIYFSGIAAVILVTLGMSFFIVVTNRGNDAAKNIHVAIVPHNIEFDIPALAVDARYEYPHHEMISEAKAAVTYQNSQGLACSQTFRLSALGKSDDDLLRPVIPLFNWK
jgi:hypothetical protein